MRVGDESRNGGLFGSWRAFRSTGSASGLSAELLSAADGIFNEIDAANLGFLNWKRIGCYAH